MAHYPGAFVPPLGNYFVPPNEQTFNPSQCTPNYINPLDPAQENPNSFITHARFMTEVIGHNQDEVLSRIVNHRSYDSAYSQSLNHDIAVMMNKYARAKAMKPTVQLNEILSIQELQEFEAMFGEFEIKTDFARDKSDHYIARAMRELSFQHLMYQFHLGDLTNRRPVAPYDVVLKDIGGSPLYHLSKGHECVHVCHPTLDHNDAIRKNNFYCVLRDKKSEENLRTDKERRLINKYINNDISVICHKKGENCNVKCQKCLLFHSAYDVRVKNMCVAMQKANALELRGCIHFHPDILLNNEGQLPHSKMIFRKFKRGGRVMIRFSFPHDTQNGYEHDYLTYIEKIKVFNIVLPSKRAFGFYDHYLYTVTEIKGDVLFFRILKNITGEIPGGWVFRTIDLPRIDNQMIVYYYEWDSDKFAGPIRDYKIRPLRIQVSKKLFNRSFAYALNLPAGKLTIANLMTAVSTFNTREVISCASTKIDEPLSQELLPHFVHAVFLLVYVKNFECSKVYSRIKKGIDAQRQLKLTNLLKNILRAVFDYRRDLIVESEIKKSLEGTMQGEMKEVSVLEKVISTIENLFTDEQRFHIIVQFSPKCFEISQELDYVLKNVERHDVGSKLYTASDELETLTPEDMLEAMASDIVEEDNVAPDCPFKMSNYISTTCLNQNLNLIPNSSKGGCLITAILDSQIEVDRNELCRRILSHPSIRTMYSGITPVSDLVRLYVDPSFESSEIEMFLPVELLQLVSDEYNVAVCIHTRDGCLKYGNDGKIHHFAINNNHIEALVEIFSLEPIFEADIENLEVQSTDNNLEILTKHLKDVDVIWESISAVRKNKTFRKNVPNNRKLFDQAKMYARQAVDRYSFLNHGGYLCRSGLKTAEILHRYMGYDFESVFSIGGPGGEIECLLDKTQAFIYGMTLTSVPNDYSPELSNSRFRQLFGFDLSGDITQIFNQNDAQKIIRSGFPDGVCRFFCDVAYSDENYTYDLARMAKEAELFFYSVRLCFKTLKKGGSAYFKVFELVNGSTEFLLNVLNTSFERVRVVKLLTSRPASMECHVICEDFLLDGPDDFDFESLKQNIAQDQIAIAGSINSQMIARELFQNQLENLLMFKKFFVCFDPLKTRNPRVEEPSEQDKLEIKKILCLETSVNVVGARTSNSRLLPSPIRIRNSNLALNSSNQNLNEIITVEADVHNEDFELVEQNLETTQVESPLEPEPVTSVFTRSYENLNDDSVSLCSDVSRASTTKTYMTAASAAPLINDKKQKSSFLSKIKNSIKNEFSKSKLSTIVKPESKLGVRFKDSISDMSVISIDSDNPLPSAPIEPVESIYQEKEFYKIPRANYVPADTKEHIEYNIKKFYNNRLHNLRDVIIRRGPVIDENVVESVYSTDVNVGITPLRQISVPGLKHQTLIKSKDKNEEPKVVNKSISRNTHFSLAISEYLMLCENEEKAELSNFASLTRQLEHYPIRDAMVRSLNGNYGIIKNGTFTVTPNEQKSSYAKVYDMKTKKFIPYNEMKNDVSYLVNDYLEKNFNPEIIKNIQSSCYQKFDFKNLKISMIQAGPGTGKTTRIVRDFNPLNTTVLLSTSEGQQDFVDRVNKKQNLMREQYNNRIRTLASVLINPDKNVDSEKLYVDEALMAHPGAILASIVLIPGVTEVKCVGDCLQIPFVNRNREFTIKYQKISDLIPVSETLYISYRCPLDVAYRLDPEYRAINKTYGLKSVNKLFDTCLIKKIIDISEVPNNSSVQYLTFTQAEKKQLKDGGFQKVSTVHEFQGKEADDVIVVRLNRLPNEDIFLRKEYALVALTRHRRSLVYFTKVTSDALCKYIKVDRVEIHSIAEQSRMLDSFESRVGYSYDEEMLSFNYSGDYRTFKTSRMDFKSCKQMKLILDVENKVEQIDYNKFLNRIVVPASLTGSKKLNLTYLKENIAKLNEICKVKEIKNLAISDSNFKFVTPTSLSQVFYKYLPDVEITLVTLENDFIQPEIFDYANRNTLNMFLPVTVKKETTELEHFVPEIFDFEPKLNVSVLQEFLDIRFSEMNYVSQAYDSYLLEFSDAAFEAANFSISNITGVYKFKLYDSMTPILKTTVPFLRDYNRREVISAFLKRNGGVPNMIGTVDVESVTDKMIDGIKKCFDNEKLKLYGQLEVKGSVAGVVDWLKTQKSFVPSQLEALSCIDTEPGDRYSLGIKRNAKPDLTLDSGKIYQSLQTIVYHEKHINAYFCDLFRQLKTRILGSLHPHIKFMTDVSLEGFIENCNRDLPFSDFDSSEFCFVSGDDSFIKNKISRLEVDISKFDKSQWYLDLVFECKWMRMFGVNEHDIQLWFNSHVATHLYDLHTKFSAVINFQRKSGDASTYLGNTMKTLGSLAFFFDFSKENFSKVDFTAYDISMSFPLLFNLEIKVFDFKSAYFCSKFFGINEKGWWFLPDPVKLLVKLGRSDLVNWKHVDEYKRSFADLTKCFRDYSACLCLNDAVIDRYSLNGDYSTFFHGIPSIVEIFESLFYIADGAVIDHNRYEFHSSD